MVGWDEPSHRLDAARLEDLFQQLDWQLGLLLPPDSAPLRISICGGAAMCYQITDRGTGYVDIMFPPMPHPLREAARIVARRRGLAADWINDGPAQFADYSKHITSRLIFEGKHIVVKSPSNKYLLGMKLHAARESDRLDVQWLMSDTGLTTTDHLHDVARQVSLSIGQTWQPTAAQSTFVESSVKEHRHEPGKARWGRLRRLLRRFAAAVARPRTNTGTTTAPVSGPAVCRHVGIRSKKRCTLFDGHRGRHRYI